MSIPDEIRTELDNTEFRFVIDDEDIEMSVPHAQAMVEKMGETRDYLIMQIAVRMLETKVKVDLAEEITEEARQQTGVILN